MASLKELYEEVNGKTLRAQVVVAGRIITPQPRSISWSYAMGQTPTLTFETDNPAPAYVVPGASVIVYVGFNNRLAMVFNGRIESASPQATGLTVQASGQSKLLDNPYKRLVLTTDGVTTSSALVTAILQAAKVQSYHVDLPAWTPGTIVQQPLQFTTYAEAVNKLAEPFGSPYYEMPTGQIRVELRDPVPAPAAFRTYFSGIIRSDGSWLLPPSITNANAQPRIRNLSVESLVREIRNKVAVRGAGVEEIGPDGETNVNVIETDADAPSPWIPDIDGDPQFVEMVIDNELLDTAATVASVAARYVELYNRLWEGVNLSVEGDPEIFLGATVQVIDTMYTGTYAPYFVEGYTSTISGNDFSTELSLRGGRAAGTTPRIDPFAIFVWTNQYVSIPPKMDTQGLNSHSLSPAAAKLKQFVPGGGGDSNGTPGRKVIITFDGSRSVDPDGRIVSYDWADDLGRTGTDRVVTFAYEPDEAGSGQMTLTVTDDDGRTDAQTETFNINTESPYDGYGTDPLGDPGPTSIPDPDLTLSDDSEIVGLEGSLEDFSGDASRVLTFVAASGGGIVVFPNGSTRRLFVGIAYCVAIRADPENPQRGLVGFGTKSGQIVFFSVQANRWGTFVTSTRQETGIVPGAVLGLTLGDTEFTALVLTNGGAGYETSLGATFKSSTVGAVWSRASADEPILSAALPFVNPVGLGGDGTVEQNGPYGVLLHDAEEPTAGLTTVYQETFLIDPNGQSYYYPDAENDPANRAAINVDGLVGIAPSMAEDDAYYAVDKTGSFYFGSPPNFDLISADVLSGLGLVSSGSWEPGTEGVMLVGGLNGLAKTFSKPGGPTTGGAIVGGGVGGDGGASLADWPYGFIFQTVTWPLPLFSPPADLVNISSGTEPPD